MSSSDDQSVTVIDKNLPTGLGATADAFVTYNVHTGEMKASGVTPYITYHPGGGLDNRGTEVFFTYKQDDKVDLTEGTADEHKVSGITQAYATYVPHGDLDARGMDAYVTYAQNDNLDQTLPQGIGAFTNTFVTHTIAENQIINRGTDAYIVYEISDKFKFDTKRKTAAEVTLTADTCRTLLQADTAVNEQFDLRRRVVKDVSVSADLRRNLSSEITTRGDLKRRICKTVSIKYDLDRKVTGRKTFNFFALFDLERTLIRVDKSNRRVILTESILEDVADAIRTKELSNKSIEPVDFAEHISKLIGRLNYATEEDIDSLFEHEYEPPS